VYVEFPVLCSKRHPGVPVPAKPNHIRKIEHLVEFDRTQLHWVNARANIKDKFFELVPIKLEARRVCLHQ
jgi:hypothetical protein